MAENENAASGKRLGPARMQFWTRYAGLYLALWRNSVVREMSFKANFLLWIMVEILWFALQLTFIAVIYSHTENIGDWTRWQVVSLVAASHLIQQLFTALFLVNCAEISELIRTGRLDFILLLPVNTRFIVSLRKVDLGSFINAFGAAVVMIYSLRQLNYLPNVAQVIAFFIFVAIGVFIHYSLLFLLASVSFWTVRAQGIVWGYYSLFNVARLPDAAFQGWFKAVFTFVLPMLLVSNVPVKILLAKLSSPADCILLLGLAIALFSISEMVWRSALRSYTSASS